MGFNPGGGGGIANASDVALSSPTNNQVLGYNGTTAKWQNQTASGGGSSAITIFNKTASFTISTAGANSRYQASSASAIIVTIPANATDPIPVGTLFEIARVGTGSAAFSPENVSVIIQSYGDYLTIARQYSTASLLKVDTDTWSLVGDLA